MVGKAHPTNESQINLSVYARLRTGYGVLSTRCYVLDDRHSSAHSFEWFRPVTDQANPSTAAASPFHFSLAWLLGYITVVSLVCGGLVYGRAQALAIYGSPEAQTEWDAWREDAKKMSTGPGPVKRRAPKSIQPPALVLMRDYFAICLAGAVLLTTVLFGTFMVFIRGAFAPGTKIGASQK